MDPIRALLVTIGLVAMLFAGCVAPAPDVAAVFPDLAPGDLWLIDGDPYRFASGWDAVDRYFDTRDAFGFYPADATDLVAIEASSVVFDAATRDILWRMAPAVQQPALSEDVDPRFVLVQLAGLEAVPGASYPTTFRDLPATIEILSVTDDADAGLPDAADVARLGDAPQAAAVAADASAVVAETDADADASADAEVDTPAMAAAASAASSPAAATHVWTVTGTIRPTPATHVSAFDAAPWAFAARFDDIGDRLEGSIAVAPPGMDRLTSHDFRFERIEHGDLPLADRVPIDPQRLADGVAVGGLGASVSDEGACSPLTTAREILEHPYFADAYTAYSAAHSEHVLALYQYAREGSPFGRYNDRPDRHIVTLVFLADGGDTFIAQAAQYTGKPGEPESALEPLYMGASQVKGVTAPENAVPLRDQLCNFARWTDASDLPTSFLWTMMPVDPSDPTGAWTTQAAGIIQPLDDWSGNPADAFAYARVDGATGALVHKVAATTEADAGTRMAPLRAVAASFGVPDRDDGWAPGSLATRTLDDLALVESRGL